MQELYGDMLMLILKLQKSYLLGVPHCRWYWHGLAKLGKRVHDCNASVCSKDYPSC